MSVYMTETEQLQAIKQWWRHYSTPILIVLTLLMLALAGYQYWSWHSAKMLTRASNAYEQLMVVFSEHNNQEIKIRANQLLRDYGATVYADVAKMTLAKIYVDEDDFDSALSLLRDIANNSKVLAFKQIAKIRIARLLISERSFNKATQQLAMVDDNSYLSIINELQGDISVATGQYDHAIILYKKALNETKEHGLGNLFLEMKTNDLIAMMQSQVNKQHITVPALNSRINLG